MIIFECHHCGARVSEEDEFAGLERRCPACEKSFRVPTASSTSRTLTPEELKAAIRSTPADDTEVDFEIPPGGGSSVRL